MFWPAKSTPFLSWLRGGEGLSKIPLWGGETCFLANLLNLGPCGGGFYCNRFEIMALRGLISALCMIISDLHVRAQFGAALAHFGAALAHFGAAPGGLRWRSAVVKNM